MTSSGDTSVMIRNLALEAGMKRSGSAFSFDTALLLGAALSFAGALMLMFATFGIHPDLAATLSSAPFHHKISSMLTVACGGVLLVRYAGRPGARGLALIAVLPGLALLIAGAILDGEAGYFTSKEFENLGGVALFKQEIEMDLFPEVSEKPLRYEFQLYVNPMARTETTLPKRFVELFSQPELQPKRDLGNSRSEAT